MMSFCFLKKHRTLQELVSMGHDERFKLLGEVLQQSPSKTVWLEICELLTRWPETPEKEAAVDYANAQMKDWDDALRHESSSRRTLYIGDEVSSFGRIIRSIQIYRREDRPSIEFSRLVESPNMRYLTHLKIIRSDVYPKLLARSPYMSNLTSFTLVRTDIERDELIELLSSNNFSRLKYLTLTSLYLRDEDIYAVTNARTLSQLVSLNLSFNRINDLGLKKLAQAPHLSNLRYLNLAHNSFHDEGLQALLDGPYLTSLQELVLKKDYRISDEQITKLKQRFKTIQIIT